MGKSKLAEAYVKVDYKDLNNLDSKIDQTGRKFVDQTGKMNQSLKIMTGLIAGVGLVALGRDIVGAATKWDSMEKSLLYVEKTQANVNKRLAEFRVIAKDPGIGLQQLTQGYIGFTSAGMKMEPAIKLMRELANNMAAMGKGATEIERVNYQLIQMKSKGIPQLEDLRVIQEAMPNINQIIRKAFGSTDIEALVKGGLDADKFIAGITEAMSKQARATTGARNAQDNFNDSLFQFKAALGESVLPAITDFLTKTTSMLDTFNAMPNVIQKLIGTGALAGGGLIALGIALNTIKTALDGIGISSGLKGLAAVGGGAVAGSAFKPIVNPSIVNGAVAAGSTGIFASSGGSAVMKIASATIQIGAALFGGYELSKLLPLPSFAKGAPKGGTVTSEEQAKTDTFLKGFLGAKGESSPELQSIINKNKGVVNTPDTYFGMEMKPVYVPPPLTESELKHLADEAIRADQAYWEKWFEYAQAITKQTIYEYSPNMLPVGTGTTGFFSGKGLGGRRMNVNLPPETPGGVPFAIGSGISNLHAGYQDYGESLRSKEKLVEITAQTDKNIEKAWQETMKGWNELTDEMLGGLDDIGTSWQDTAQTIIKAGNLFGDVLQEIMGELGYDVSGWRYKDPKLEAERQSQMKANARETTPLGWFNKIMSWGNQAASSIIPMTMAEGGTGIVSKPTLFMAGEAGAERFSFEPLSNGRNSRGGVTINNMTVVVPDTWDRQRAENVVVNAIRDAQSHGRI